MLPEAKTTFFRELLMDPLTRQCGFLPSLKQQGLPHMSHFVYVRRPQTLQLAPANSLNDRKCFLRRSRFPSQRRELAPRLAAKYWSQFTLKMPSSTSSGALGGHWGPRLFFGYTVASRHLLSPGYLRVASRYSHSCLFNLLPEK